MTLEVSFRVMNPVINITHFCYPPATFVGLPHNYLVCLVWSSHNSISKIPARCFQWNRCKNTNNKKTGKNLTGKVGDLLVQTRESGKWRDKGKRSNTIAISTYKEVICQCLVYSLVIVSPRGPLHKINYYRFKSSAACPVMFNTTYKSILQ